jgi:hypothetical protein
VSDLIRLIEGLRVGDPTAIAVLIFAVTGTAVIYAITEVIQQRRRKNKH